MLSCRTTQRRGSKCSRESAGGGLPFYERYVAGERTGVWNELVEMGEQIQYIEHAADALAVAYATMDSAARNINLLVDRLNMLHYEFANPAWEKPSPDPGIEWREVDRRLDQSSLPARVVATWLAASISQAPTVCLVTESICQVPALARC